MTITQCPYLAMADRRIPAHDVPDTEHRCYALQPANAVDPVHQRAFCLAEAYPKCAAFIGASAQQAETTSGGKAQGSGRWTRWIPVGVLAAGLLVVALHAGML